jgi:hypothetical protein
MFQAVLPTIAAARSSVKPTRSQIGTACLATGVSSRGVQCLRYSGSSYTFFIGSYKRS